MGRQRMGIRGKGVVAGRRWTYLGSHLDEVVDVRKDGLWRRMRSGYGVGERCFAILVGVEEDG